LLKGMEAPGEDKEPARAQSALAVRNMKEARVDEHPRARNCVAPIGKTVGAQCARFNKPN